MVAGYFALDASCRSTATEFATQGTITLTLVTAHTVEGSFDLTAFSSPTNDQVTGTFTAPFCHYDAIRGGVDGGSRSTPEERKLRVFDEGRTRATSLSCTRSRSTAG